MGCDCGLREETEAEKAACAKSAQLEAPDQVYKFDKTSQELRMLSSVTINCQAGWL